MQQEKLSDVDCSLWSSQDEKFSQNTSQDGLSVKTRTEHAAGTTGEGLPGPSHFAAVHLRDPRFAEPETVQKDPFSC